jgi:hypothetical protein
LFNELQNIIKVIVKVMSTKVVVDDVDVKVEATWKAFFC